MKKVTEKISAIFAVLGFILSLAGVLIYNILPFSELANGIQYSATDALGVFILSPIFLFLGGSIYILALLTDIKNWKGILTDIAIYPSVIVFAATAIFNFAASLAYYNLQKDVGFVAPYTGLRFETFVIPMIVFLVWQFVFTILAVAETVRKVK